MINKVQALETMINMVIEAAADTEDLQMILDVLYNKTDEIDSKIISIEEEM